MIQTESIVKVPKGFCPHCGKDHGMLVLVKTGEQIGEYNDCACNDSAIFWEIAEEEYESTLEFAM